MPITLLSGPANAGKVRLVFEELRGALARDEQCLLVVPTGADAAYHLRELARERVVIGLRVRPFEGLLEECATRGRVARDALSETARLLLLGRLALECGLVSERTHPPRRGLERALASVISELEVRRVSPERLQRALARWARAGEESPQGAALGRLYTRYEQTLRRIGRLGAEQRALAALDALRATPQLWRGTPVLFYGFDSFTALQLEVI